MKNFFYRVKQGDTFLTVAHTFNVPFINLIEENNLTGEICAGDILYIKYSDNVYTVKAEDSLKEIAERFSVSPEYILESNKTPYIFYGQIIRV